MVGKKAQINIEFMAGAAFYLITLGAVMTTGADIVPGYHSEAEKAGLNLEARTLTNTMLSEKGKHSYREGGNNWEQDPSKIKNTEILGIAEGFMEVDREKINTLSTVGSANNGVFNYTMFKQVTEVENQYRFNFTWKPIIKTEETFTKNQPPSDPPIQEPEHELYQKADNEIHYGSTELEGEDFFFLVTSHNGVYNTTYYTKEPNNWDFRLSEPYGVRETLVPESFNVESFQNRENDPGSVLIISDHINTFGASPANSTTVENLLRFPTMEGHPLKIEVLTW